MSDQPDDIGPTISGIIDDLVFAAAKFAGSRRRAGLRNLLIAQEHLRLLVDDCKAKNSHKAES